MEKIKFEVLNYGTFCRIVARDIRTKYRKVADGGCISSLKVLLSEIEYIRNAVEAEGCEAEFVIDKPFF